MGKSISDVLNEFQEGVTLGPKVITTDHGLIHSGRGFTLWYYIADLADNATQYVKFTTAATRYVHLKNFQLWCDNAQVWLKVHENPNSVSGGSAFTPPNRSRLSSTASGVTITTNATVTLGSAVMLDYLIAGGGGANPNSRAGGDRPLDIELVLKQSEDYIFEITNKSGAAADVMLWVFWYEEDSGEPS